MDLNSKESAIIQAKLMFKKDFKMALKWLETRGYKMSQNSNYVKLRDLDSKGAERLYEIGKSFPAFHADEIEKFLMIESQLYEQYYQEKEPLNKAKILKMIADVQPLITSLYDSTQYVLEANARFLSRKEEEPIIN